jgi:hypothetical protein
MASINGIRDGVVTRGRFVLGEATKPVYAWIGAGEFAVDQVASRLKGLRGTLPASPAAVRGAVEGYGALALSGYAELARRGERVVGTIRQRSTDSVEAQETPVAEPPVAARTTPRKASGSATGRRSTSDSPARRRPAVK